MYRHGSPIAHHLSHPQANLPTPSTVHCAPAQPSVTSQLKPGKNGHINANPKGPYQGNQPCVSASGSHPGQGEFEVRDG